MKQRKDGNPRRIEILTLVLGLIGCVLMAASDWIMIYGNTAFEGKLAWLTVGAAQISARRNGLAMFLAFPAAILYCIALMGLSRFVKEQKVKKTYRMLTAIGMLPWLCLHLFYVMILGFFAWLSGAGYADLAQDACYAMFRHLGWIVIVGEAVMLVPFVHLFWIIRSGKTRMPGWMAFVNPILIYLVLKTLTGVFGTAPWALAFVNGLMSESMLVFFAVWLAVVLRRNYED